MKYYVKRFSISGYTQSSEISETTINGKTKGVIKKSATDLKTGKGIGLKIKYRKGGRDAFS